MYTTLVTRLFQSRNFRIVGRLTLELLVVFIGVYAASTLSQQQSARAEEAHALALRRALAQELTFIHTQGETINVAEIDQFIAAILNGRQPALPPFTSRIPFSPDVWEAALASGGVRLLEPTLVVKLSRFYGSMRALMLELEDQRDYIRDIMLPNLDQPTSEFYDEAGTLRPKYRWYLQHLEYLSKQIPALTGAAESLQHALSAEHEP